MEDVHNYSRTVLPRMTRFGLVTYVVEGRISKGSATTQSCEVGPAKIYWTSLLTPIRFDPEQSHLVW